MTEGIKGVDETPKRGSPHIGTAPAPEGYYDTLQAADVLEVHWITLRNNGARNRWRRNLRPLKGHDIGLKTKDAAAYNRLYWPVWKVWAARHQRIHEGRITPMRNDPAYSYPCGVPRDAE